MSRSLGTGGAALVALTALIFAPLAGGGCNWTEFDDLETETWVTSTGAPENASTSWGVAIARVSRSGQPARLAVLGASEPTYNDLLISADGSYEVTSELEINPQFVTGNLPISPILLANPDGDDAALVTGVTDGRITVIRSIAGQLSQLLVNKATMQPSAATYLRPPTGETQIVVAQGNTVFGVPFAPPPGFDQQKCLLRDGAGADVVARALGAYRAGASDNLIALSESGKLALYTGGPAFVGCGTGAITPIGNRVLDIGLTGIVTGSQIVSFVDGTTAYFLLQANGDGARSHLGLYKIEADVITAVGAPRTDPGVRSATLLSAGGKRYAVAGYPTDLVEGVAAGQVRAFELSTATGLAATPAMTLSDADPEERQLFGRGVVALPFGASTILAVAAENDVFLYFRTALYNETRQGR
jgi:hypothetical protein